MGTDFHGDVSDGYPTTIGTVRSVEIEYSQGVGQGTPIAPPVFRPVHTSPKWFSREQAGVLVVIELGDARATARRLMCRAPLDP
jgi:hypothetical protein